MTVKPRTRTGAYVGIDLSTNHSALVAGDGSNKVTVRFVWNNGAPFKEPMPGNTSGVMLSKPDDRMEPLANTMVKINTHISEYVSYLLQLRALYGTVVVGIEDFARNKVGWQVLQVAGASYLLQDFLFQNNFPYYMVDPKRIKAFAGKGNYSKDEMVAAAREHMYIPDHFLTSKDAVGHDIADAFWLMRVIRAIWEVNYTDLGVLELPACERDVLIKPTKAAPGGLYRQEPIQYIGEQ